MEALISSCLESGWTLHGVKTDPTQMCLLIPPEGDPRLTWCATWEKVKYHGNFVLVPHWAQPGPLRK